MDYEVVHATVGRFRLRIPRLRWDEAYSQKLAALVESLQFVTQVRINPEASSLIVSYTPASISGTVAETFLGQCIRRAAGVDIAAEPVHFSQAEADATDQAAWESEAEAELQPESDWQRLGLPFVSLGLALLIVPLELPPLLVGATIVLGAAPWFSRASDHLVNQRYLSPDLLDSLWIGLHTLNGQFVAPALKTSLVGTRADLRDRQTLARQSQAQNLLPASRTTLAVERQGQEHHLPVWQIQVGDRLLLQEGETVPVDGAILSGTALVNQQSLTGEPTPVLRLPGECLYASTQLLTGQVTLLVQRTGDNTRAALVAKFRQQEPVYDTQIAVLQAEFAKAAVLPTLMAGAGIFAATGIYSAAIAPFQLDFGSGVQLSLRTVLLSALIQALHQGIYIRSAGALEALAQVNTLVLDQPPITATTARMIASLRNLGLDIHLLTSAPATDHRSLAIQLGLPLTQVHTEILPEDKANIVRLLHSRRRQIAFFGEGIGDFPAFTEATLSITVAKDSDVIHKAADVVLLDRDFRALPQAIALAREAMQIVYQNAAIIIIPNLVVVAGGVFFGLNPVVNVITNNTTAFIAEFLNSNRPVFTPTLSATLPQSHSPELSSHLQAISLGQEITTVAETVGEVVAGSAVALAVEPEAGELDSAVGEGMVAIREASPQQHHFPIEDVTRSRSVSAAAPEDSPEAVGREVAAKHRRGKKR